MKYVYEFIGTFFLVLTVGMTVIEPNGVGLLAPLAIGSMLAVLIFAGAHVSGAHYNPAVSLAIFLRGKIAIKDLGIYWSVQFLSALLAGFCTIYFKGFAPDIPLSLDAAKLFLAEFLFTFALCFVVLNVALAKANKGNSFYGWAIGFTVLAGAYAVGAVSGAAFNPAVVFGLSIMQLSPWANLWIYFVANFLSAIAAAFLFNFVERKSKKKRD